jgi:hypothetical protein
MANMIGSVIVLLSGIYLWMHGYQNIWVFIMITLGTIRAIDRE